MIEQEEKGDKVFCTLESEDKELEIEISSGIQSLAFIESEDFDFARILSGEDKRIRLNQLGLRLKGEANLTNITEEDFSIVLFEDAEIYAVEPWTEEPEQIF
ncbi:MAG: hypothetical protein H8Z69_05325 [Nanohaloarchaea archaeon]|nr:hypothetical protein [Candidatus Nanohaloarchaea archaeon]